VDKVQRLCYDLGGMQSIEINTKSSKETQKVGLALALTLEKELTDRRRALVIALEGNLGSGKTTFIQGLAKGLKVKENVLSPTFVIQKDFPLSLPSWKNFYHIDAYRLKNPEELLELGFEDLIKNPENLIVIEWADKVKKLLPRNIWWIRFENLGGDKRKITI